MKFFPSGPDIPDELLKDVIAGQAVFICGAGVSYCANMPLFDTLTYQIYKEIGEVPTNEPAEEAALGRGEYDRALRSLERRTRLPKSPSRVRIAATKLLTPDPKNASPAHLNLLRLSRDADGRIRLITTNFDPIFECEAHRAGLPAPSHAGKSLPRPGTPDDHGILHLHGRIAFAPRSLAASDMVLTSADFGDAYLRDGWASRYIEDRMRLNTLILVGYAAEDTAMRLLLETLDADRDRFQDLKAIYALEKQTSASASIWRAKGIAPIEFQTYDQLYETVAEWAAYVTDPVAYGNSKMTSILTSKTPSSP